MATHIVNVYFGLGGGWVQVDDQCLQAHTITWDITAGDQWTRLAPCKGSLVLLSRDGQWHPENPLGTWYGHLKPGVPVAIEVDGQQRFQGVVESWSPRRPLGGPRTVTVTLSGVLTRLAVGTALLMSPLPYAITQQTSPAPALYMPLTEGPAATGPDNVVSGRPGTWDLGFWQFGQVDGPPGAPAKLPETSGGTSPGFSFPAYTAILDEDTGTDWTVDFVVRFDPVSAAAFDVIPIRWDTSGGLNRWYLQVFHDGVRLTALEPTGTVFPFPIEADDSISIIDGQWHHIRAVGYQLGADVEAELYVDDELVALDTAAGYTGGRIQRVTVMEVPAESARSGSIGHVTVWPTDFPPDIVPATFGWPGETPADRVAALCAQLDVTLTTVTAPDEDTKVMQGQLDGRPLDVLSDCISTDGGLLYEDRTGGLTMVPLAALYNAAPVDISVDAMVQPELGQVTSLAQVRNDVTAVRRGGGQSRYQLPTGPLGIEAPPDGVGVLDTRLDVSPLTDEPLYWYASWLVAQGCVEGVRYDSLTLDLDADPSIPIDDIGIGTVIRLVDQPVIDDPRSPLLLVVGIVEQPGTHRRLVTLRTRPADPYYVGLLDDGIVTGAGRLTCTGSVTAEALDATETGVDLTISDSCGWGHGDGDYDLVIGGEQMTVTAVGAITGTMGARSQTLTVVRSVNGVVKTHSAGARVTGPTDPFRLTIA